MHNEFKIILFRLGIVSIAGLFYLWHKWATKEERELPVEEETHARIQLNSRGITIRGGDSKIDIHKDGNIEIKPADGKSIALIPVNGNLWLGDKRCATTKIKGKTGDN